MKTQCLHTQQSPIPLTIPLSKKGKCLEEEILCMLYVEYPERQLVAYRKTYNFAAMIHHQKIRP